MLPKTFYAKAIHSVIKINSDTITVTSRRKLNLNRMIIKDL